MKIRYSTLLLLMVTTISLIGQIDQVSVGANYSKQAYYNLATGEVVSISNEAWDIAFSANGVQDAGIIINESSSSMGSTLQVYLAPTSDWSTIISDTEGFVDSVALHNPLKNWTEGALNTVKNVGNPFDYGWGSYQPATNQVVGNKIYVFRNRDGSFFKFQVVSLIGSVYNCRFAQLNGANEVNFEIDKNDTTNGLIYYSFTTFENVAIPSDYDLVFQRYIVPLDAGGGETIQYTVMGVLSAPGVETVVVDGVDPANVDFNDYKDNFTSTPTNIGHEWKVFDFSAGWVIDADKTQFVKLKNGDVYQLTFFDFEGQSTGTTTLEKTLVGTLSSDEDVNNGKKLTMYPNPTIDYFQLKYDTDTEIQVNLTDMQGRLIMRWQVFTNQDVALPSLEAGMYTISVFGNGINMSLPLVIK